MFPIWGTSKGESHSMHVVGIKRLTDYTHDHTDLKKAVEAWLCEAQVAQWKTPQDIKARYAHASFLTNNNVVFNLKGNNYRLHVQIHFATQTVVIKRIGTHAEYNTWEF